MRSEFKNQRSELRSKYKKSFATKLENRLDSISETKLEKILIVIDNKIGEVEVNTKLSEIQKERILSQLEALKEIINEKLSMLEDAIDIDSIIK